MALANMLWAAVVLQERPGPRWMACAETCLLARMRGGCPLPVLCTCTFALGALHHQVGGLCHRSVRACAWVYVRIRFSHVCVCILWI